MSKADNKELEEAINYFIKIEEFLENYMKYYNK